MLSRLTLASPYSLITSPKLLSLAALTIALSSVRLIIGGGGAGREGGMSDGGRGGSEGGEKMGGFLPQIEGWVGGVRGEEGEGIV